MLYVRVPREITTKDLSENDCCFSPGRYVRFVPPSTSSGMNFVPLDRLVKVRDEVVQVKKANFYRYAEIGDIDVRTGGIQFHRLRGYQLPTVRPAVARWGDVLIPPFGLIERASGTLLMMEMTSLRPMPLLTFAAHLTIFST
jgi:hypothetical protein